MQIVMHRHVLLDSDSMNKSVLILSLLSCVDTGQPAGLFVKALIYDQGMDKSVVVKSHGVTVTNPTFKHRANKIHVIYDLPHIFKNIRNNQNMVKKMKFDKVYGKKVVPLILACQSE